MRLIMDLFQTPWINASFLLQSDDCGRQPVAITAMASLLPAATAAGDAPHAVPLARWDADEFASEKFSVRLETRFGAFVAGCELFDATAFNISR